MQGLLLLLFVVIVANNTTNTRTHARTEHNNIMAELLSTMEGFGMFGL